MTRIITDHIINPANEALAVTALDGPGPGGASHEYTIAIRQECDRLVEPGIGSGQPRQICAISFQNGPVKEDGNGINGVTHEALLAVLIDRLRGFQSGPYACPENALALSYMEAALAALNARTKAREARGVEGTHKV